MDISIYKNQYEVHHEKYLNISCELKNVDIEHPYTNEVINDIYLRLEYIFISMLDLAEKENLYSINILFRSQIEHFITSFYLVHKMVNDNSDEAAKDYLLFFYVNEHILEQKAFYKLQYPDVKNRPIDFKTFLVAKFPNLIGFDKDNENEISAKNKQFEFNEMISFLSNNYDKIKSDNLNQFNIKEILVEYSKLSSYVHGGAYASKLYAIIKENNHLTIEIDRILQLSLTMLCTIKENIFLTYKIKGMDLMNQVREMINSKYIEEPIK